MIRNSRFKPSLGGIAAAVAAALLAAAAVFPPGAAAAQGALFGGFQHDSTQPLSVEADNFNIENAANKGVLTGNVRVVQGVIKIRCDRLEIYYSGKGGAKKAASSGSLFGGGSAVDRLVASGKVIIKDGNQRAARAKKADYDVAAREILMTGNVALMEIDEKTDRVSGILQGDKLKIDLASGTARIINEPKAGGGRVRMTIDPTKKN